MAATAEMGHSCPIQGVRQAGGKRPTVGLAGLTRHLGGAPGLEVPVQRLAGGGGQGCSQQPRWEDAASVAGPPHPCHLREPLPPSLPPIPGKLLSTRGMVTARRAGQPSGILQKQTQSNGPENSVCEPALCWKSWAGLLPEAH